MNYDKIIEYFAQKVDESRREEFREKASKIKDASEAEALGKEFGIVPDAEDRKLLVEMAGDMELSADVLRQVAGGTEYHVDWGPGRASSSN
jgi:hypothetical protein